MGHIWLIRGHNILYKYLTDQPNQMWTLVETPKVIYMANG